MSLGTSSLLLLVAAANALLLAALLVLPTGRHGGSRWLAALTTSIALRTAPYILGYAGAYDRYPALTFAPFDITLAWGPLLWAYVTTLATGAAPARMRWHFAPAALQLAYQLVCFALPLPTKWDWYTGAHLAVVEPIGAIVVLASLGAYSLAAWRRYEHWQAWLDQNLSNREESRLDWLRVVLLGIAGTGVLGIGMMVTHLFVAPLDYFARLPIIIALAVLTYMLGLLGLRYGPGTIAIAAAVGAPEASDTDTVDNTVNTPDATSDATIGETKDAARDAMKDYAAQAGVWRNKVVDHAWHRDPQLTLTTLAAALDTSPRTLSRTLNEGLGVSFNDFINRLRVDEAVQRLRASNAPDVLRVALDVGFASKASFNRAFKRHTGTTPSGIKAESAGAVHDSTSQIRPLARPEAHE